MSAPWNFLIAIAALAVGYVLLPVAATTFFDYRGKKSLRCPLTGEEAKVGIDARRAAFTSVLGKTRLRVQDCSLWPGKRHCAQDCLRPFTSSSVVLHHSRGKAS